MTTATIAAPLSVLVADDQEDIRIALNLALKGRGFEVETAASPGALLAALRRRRYDAVLMDLNYTRDTTSGAEGLEILPQITAIDGDVPVFVMTAWGTIGLAVEVMRSGAADFVLKPWNNEALIRALGAEVARRRTVRDERAAGTRDLAGARDVQARLLPQQTPSMRTVEVAARCVEAAVVGGDGYDFIDLGGGRTAIVLADVAGKGVAAALLWASLQATLRSQAPRGESDLVGLARSANRAFLDCSAPERYATIFIGIYDDDTRRLRYINCGHNPPLLVRRGGGCDRLPATAPVVGLLPDWDGMAAETSIAAGDTLLLYSDGITEAGGAAGVELGEGRLMDLLRGCDALPLPQVPDVIVSEAKAFAGGRQDDDMTVLALRGR